MISDAAHSMGSNVSSNIGDLLGLSEERPKSASAAPPHPPGANTNMLHTAEEARGWQAHEGQHAVGEYLAALSLAASNSTDAPALVKRLNTSALHPALSAGVPFCRTIVSFSRATASLLFSFAWHWCISIPWHKKIYMGAWVQVAQRLLGFPSVVQSTQYRQTRRC